MKITTTGLTSAAAFAAIIAGALFAGIQLIHPAEDLESVAGAPWVIVGVLTVVMAVAGLSGVTGVMAHLAARSASAGATVVGFAGYLLMSAFFLLTAAFAFAETFVLPPLAGSVPTFVSDVIGIAGGADPQGDVGALAIFGPISGALFMLGGVVLGIALWWSRAVPRWIGVLLAVGAIAPLAAAGLPGELLRYAAFPVAAALVALGVAVWRRRLVSQPV